MSMNDLALNAHPSQANPYGAISPGSPPGYALAGSPSSAPNRKRRVSHGELHI